jgi:ACS family sodium-dependent inorganic phosphate cotransporter
VSGDICEPTDEDLVSNEGGGRGIFDWSEEVQGLILSSFYFGYIVTHIPGDFI